MIQCALLGLIQILQHGTCRDDTTVIVSKPQSLQASHLKMLPQHPAAAFILEKMGIQG